MDALVQLDLDDVLEEDDKPAEMSKKLWKWKNKLALGSIRASLATSIGVNYQHETSAKELWGKLEVEYLVKNAANRVHLKRNLYRFNMKKGTTLAEHLDSFTKLLADLVNYEEVIQDEDKALCLVNSLPEKYEPVIKTVIHGNAGLKYEEIVTALRSDEFRKIDREDISKDDKVETGGALVARSKVNRKFGRDEKSKGTFIPRRDGLEEDQCAFCFKKGHWKYECPKLKVNKRFAKDDEKSEDGGDSGGKANIVVDPDDYSFVASSVIFTKKDWLIDSGCSFHVCPRRELFSNFKELDHHIVRLGNGYACRVHGIGTIKLKLNNGVVKELVDVRYIPNFKVNLISLGVLESLGMNIVMEKGTLKIGIEDCLVFEGTRRHGLYILDGSALSLGGDYPPQFELKNLDSTKLHGRGSGERIRKIRQSRRHLDRLEERARNMEIGATPFELEGITTNDGEIATVGEILNAHKKVEVVKPVGWEGPKEKNSLGCRGNRLEASSTQACVEVEIVFGSLDPIVLKTVGENLEVMNLQAIDERLV